MTLTITFLGAANTVTGSKYLVEDGNHRILVDCGLFQGFKNLRLRNWARLPVDPRSIDTVLLTHAHLDHSGYLPLLIKNGFDGRVICSQATAELCNILLPDSGHLAEKEADFANRHGFSKHKPALPLYDQQDAENALKSFYPIEFHKDFKVGRGASMKLHRAGHILGAASIELNWHGTQILFSGDLGRYHDATMMPPDSMKDTKPDFIFVESTYGNRRHPTRDPEQALTDFIAPVIKGGGTVVVPAFAVGRAQALQYHLDRLRQTDRLPRDLPVYLDSPMAIDASDIFCRHPDDHKLIERQCRDFGAHTVYVRDMNQSKALTADATPKVIISASGMATGGRVLHHLKHYAPDPKNAILFTGFQAGGTRGASIVGGADMIKIFGEYVPIRAKVDNLEMMSAHADCDELMRWLGTFPNSPKGVFVTHGEPAAADALRMRIEDEKGWPSLVPEQGQKIGLA